MNFDILHLTLESGVRPSSSQLYPKGRPTWSAHERNRIQNKKLYDCFNILHIQAKR